MLKQHKRHMLQYWLKLDAHVDVESFIEVAIPPWDVKGTGTVEFFVLLSDEPPEDVVSLDQPRWRAHAEKVALAGECARNSAEVADKISALKRKCYADMHTGHNPEGKQKKRLKPHEQQAVEEILMEAQREGRKQWQADHRTLSSVKMPYPRRVVLNGPSESAETRQANKRKAIATMRAQKFAADVHAADPNFGGGRDIGPTHPERFGVPAL